MRHSWLHSTVWMTLVASVQSFPPPLGTKRSPARWIPLHMSSTQNKPQSQDDSFIASFSSSSECDDVNTPPSLSILLRSLQQLPSGSDIRGHYLDHPRIGNIATVAQAIGKSPSGLAPLTPLSAHCFGFAFATMLKDSATEQKTLVVAVGQDPRPHGSCLCDAFARGAESVEGVRVVYTGIATTPSMFEFCRANMCDGGVMVTASHLPVDRNGFKFFTASGGFSKRDVQQLVKFAETEAQSWHDRGILPPRSGEGAVFCSEWVEYMPHYASTLREAIVREVASDLTDSETSSVPLPLSGLRIVLNAGNGSGGFFNSVLHDLGADVSASIHVEPNGDFPAGVPNPEYEQMIDETTRVCEEANADIGIMLDTDADRCGFVVPRVVASDGTCSHYEALNRNRLIALLSVIFAKSSPGSAVVTDSVTSEGLAEFLEEKLGLQHVRFLKGYANVISRAQELSLSGTANAEMAIETSGHCAMRENGYLDDGTYTAVKVIGLLARQAHAHGIGGERKSLLDLISELKEMPEVKELRMEVLDGTLESTSVIFDFAALKIEDLCSRDDISETSRWSLDKENLEGIRVRIGNGGFFMLRKSLHDPIVSFQVEGVSREEVRSIVVQPLLELFRSEQQTRSSLDLSALEAY